MRRLCALFLTVVFAAGPCLFAEEASTPQAVPAVTPPAAAVAVKYSPDGKPILEDSTPVRMRTRRNLSSADCKVNDQIDFEVLDPVVLDGITVIPQGGIAMGKVTESEHKKSMGRAGKLNIVIESVKMTNGEKAALRAVKDTKGGGHVGAMTGAIVATSIVFFPAAPLFLFVHGKDITIPSGTEITAYVNGDTVFTPLGPPPGAAAQQPAPGPALAPIAPPPPPADTPPPLAKTISLGQTREEVVAILGQPQKVVKLSTKEMLYYPDMKITLVEEKVTDVQ
jgi:hypothetical protein